MMYTTYSVGFFISILKTMFKLLLLCIYRRREISLKLLNFTLIYNAFVRFKKKYIIGF